MHPVKNQQTLMNGLISQMSWKSVSKMEALMFKFVCQAVGVEYNWAGWHSMAFEEAVVE